MKEFVEKLIKRLEEEKHDYVMRWKWKGENEEDWRCMEAIEKVIGIVEQLAEEHNNGFCEWEIDGVYLHSPHKELFVSCLEEEPHRYKYCPICGKRIKIAKEPSDTWKQQTMSRFERVE